MSKWEWKKLGDLYPIVMGKTPPRGDSSYWDKEKKTNNIWVSIADISANENSIIRDSKEYISNKAAKNIKLVASDSLLVSFKLTIGKMAFAGVPLYTNEAIISLPPRKDISLEYLHKYFLYFDWDKACSGDVKVKGKTLNKEKLKNIDVLLPPLSEQKRIVKFLDEEFSKIDTLKTNAETNLKNAKELFETTLEKELNPLSRHSERSEESSADLPSGWEWVALNNVCKKIFAGGDKPQNCSKKSNEILSVPVYANAIENEGLYGYTDKAVVKEPCLTISARGTIGFTVKRTEPFVPIIRLIVLIPKMDVIDLDYFFFSVKHLKIVGNGTSIPQLTVPLVKQYTIPLPPLSVQKEIVVRLDKLSENVKRLEANYKQIIANCDELKKSILKKTFEGVS